MHLIDDLYFHTFEIRSERCAMIRAPVTALHLSSE